MRTPLPECPEYRELQSAIDRMPERDPDFRANGTAITRMKQFLKKRLSRSAIWRMRFIAARLDQLRNTPRTFINRTFFRSRLVRSIGKLHIGCSQIRLPGFVNVDYRPTKATDFSMDCSDLSWAPPASVDLVFSKAFFEHLYVDQRQTCLTSVNRCLRDEGLCIFTGLPDFEVVARAYLDGGPGITTRTFDASQVYRYTHGEPEAAFAASWWILQLHKSILDKPVVERLLRTATFSSFVIFNYCYKEEKVPLNIAFVARKSLQIEEDEALSQACRVDPSINRSTICNVRVGVSASS